MKEKWHFIFYLMWFSYLILTAILMFGHGFLLSRKTLNDITECISLNAISCDGSYNTSKDNCSNDVKIRQISSNLGAPPVCPPERNRVVLVLVDALRYDFTEYNHNIEKPLYYQNRIPLIHKIIEQWPEHSRLYRFMADPPTTTFQRVKALVTGSLPTFVDASSNFAAMELQEDNIVDQVVKNGGKAVLLGDDTWSRLMPGRWLRSHALYSFHTWDLDTVDNEVDLKIYDELKKDDWDLLIAHYLGVDHAGHRYGPNHPEMARKLDEVNKRLERIIEIIPKDVLLCVIGDHGMTESGDHGGESKAERTAAMFVYRGSGLGGVEKSTGKEVQQTDLAPTLSAVLGRPPPSPSLGNLLFTVLPKMSISMSLLHLSNNLKQVTKYLVRYGEESQQISVDKLTQLINSTRDHIEKCSNVRTDADLQKYYSDVKVQMENVRFTFREVWIEFDSLSMLRALLLMLLAIFFNWLLTEGVPFDRLNNIFASTFVPSGLISMAICIAVTYNLFYFKYLDDLEHSIILSTGLVSAGLTCVLVIMHWDGITQRWYEGRSIFYERFSRAALVASAVVLVSNSYVIEEGATLFYLSFTVMGLMAWNVGTIKALALWMFCGIVLSTTRLYRGCREEQGDCWTAGEGAPTGQASRAALVLALGSVSATVSIARRHIEWQGYGIAFGGILVCAHWAVGWGSLGSPAQSKLMAKLAWLVLAVMFILLWKRDKRGATLPLMIIALLLYLANVLVLGASYAPAAALALLSGFLTLNIVSLLKADGSSKLLSTARWNSSVACLWCLLASYNFYGTGHHATLGHIRWAPVFHAGDPNYLWCGPIITVVLTSIHLFGMPLLFGATTPLLVLWGKNSVSALGPRAQMAAVFSLCLKFSLCFAIRVFVSALSATIHCRHLMIWGVFTPKLLFESGACAAAFLGTILGATLTAWHMPSQLRNS